MAYQGQTYDAETGTVTGTPNSGNPVSYYNGTRWTFGWTNGRQLTTATDGDTNIAYTYTADGLRTSKTVDGVKHTYLYAGGKLLRETYGETVLDFFYDANGNPFALKLGDATYYYITNLQGDVLFIVDAEGETVAAYTYDSYGKVLTATGTLAETNPLRYRGYYYDVETGFYYLQTRYYDPTICRFINADEYASTGQGILGHNMLAYCNNSPTNGSDPCGSCLHWVWFWKDCDRCAGLGKEEKTYVNVIDFFTKLSNNIKTIQNTVDTISKGVSDVVSFVTNDDPAKVGDASSFALYNGTPYIIVPSMTYSAFSLGVVFIGELGADDPNLVRHEYGHIKHLKRIGIKNYLIKVVVPSVICFWANRDNRNYNYYSAPFEYIADFLGGVNAAERDYLPNTAFWGAVYYHFSYLG